jgi:hypothetical protein
MFSVSRENFPTSQNIKYKIYPKVLTFHLHVKIGFCSIISFQSHVLNLWSHIKSRFQFHTKIGPCSIFLLQNCEINQRKYIIINIHNKTQTLFRKNSIKENKMELLKLGDTCFGTNFINYNVGKIARSKIYNVLATCIK